MRKIPFSSLAFTGLGFALCLPLANAQTDTDQDFNLSPLVVTTTLATETADESLSSVTLIDQDTLERQQPRELRTVLQAQPGVNVVSNGGLGKNTSVFTRGTGSESTVLLLDGIRIRSATSGSPPWQHIPPQLLNRIEVVRGPRGSLYGADAVGGVIQGFTLLRDDRDRAWVEVGGGSFSTRQAGAGVSGREGNTRYSLAGHSLDSEGTRLVKGGEDKGYRNLAGTASVRHQFDSGAELGLLSFRSQGNTEFQRGDTDFVVQTLGVNGEIPLTDHWSTGVTLSESRDESETESGQGTSVFDTKTETARWENNLYWGAQRLVLGAEYQRDEVDSTTAFDEDSRDNRAVFGQWLAGRGSLDSQFSLRWDDNEAFGEEVTGAVALGWTLDSHHRLRASYGTAFRAPTFNDLYFPFTDFGFGFQFEGNSGLEPETSETVELGARGQYEVFYWDLALYQTDVDDLIQTSEQEDGVNRPSNVNQARIRGAELATGASRGGMDLKAVATLLDPRDRETDNRLPRRPIQSVRVDADYTDGKVNFGASAIIQGDRYEDAGNNRKISGFATANLRVGVQVTPRLKLRFTLENMFDRQYSTTGSGFLAPGRTVFASLRYGVF
ncbi:MAG: TonB-dependent receptor [Oleiphilaceae bacterium]|nr:TonB-dependent receptor [Oleiphilaceae bacterium]